METVGLGNELAESSLRLADEFAGFGPAYRRWIQHQLQGSEVSYSRMRLLWTLKCGGSRIMSEISEELGVSRRNVTALVDALEDEGHVRRRNHPTDRRATLIELTDRGRESTGRLFEQHRAAVARIFEALPEDDREEMIRLMGRIREALQNEGIPAQRPGR